MLGASLARRLVAFGARRPAVSSCAPLSAARKPRAVTLRVPLFEAYHAAAQMESAAKAEPLKAEKLEVVHGSVTCLTLPLSSGEKYVSHLFVLPLLSLSYFKYFNFRNS